ncbi:hypothetical protein L596_022232 [Steinernema carpocapsae]|uniref:Uncharacterized protein n=1 Tax=Steinernema carpocapsae TaxID=34508 RepID=A0A4U5ML68_STECR|nr:hypothetical protein L596_022232 [Steinernema carpocapsae]
MSSSNSLLTLSFVAMVLCSMMVASRPLSKVDDVLLPIIAQALVEHAVPNQYVAVPFISLKLRRNSRETHKSRTSPWERLGPIWG